MIIGIKGSILDVSNAPKEIRDSVIRSDQLVNFIKKDLEKLSKDDLSSPKTMFEVAESFLKADSNIYHSVENKYKNRDEELSTKLPSIDKEKLKQVLIEFRKERSKKLNMSAYYIYNNEEMDKIIDEFPQTIEELSNILPLVKVKTHGKEIIEVIKDFRR